jgi:membrane protein
MVISLSLSVLRPLLRQLHVPLISTYVIYKLSIWELFLFFVPPLLAFFMFWGMYNWVPNIDVGWRTAFWGALFAAISWETIKVGFARFLGIVIARYQLVYGSLNIVVALMLWIYLEALVILFGAHLSAAIGQYAVEPMLYNSP